ncbi:MAG: sugar phosphate nucleotidyltransferase [Flavobacteriaceae bacterium]
MTENISLLILAGGASSRMKRSLETVTLSDNTKSIAKRAHKSLIPLGKTGHPLLHYLLKNAKAAGYKKVYLITSPENEAFKDFLTDNGTEELSVQFAIQYLPEGRYKPLGTADALEQAMDQFPELKKTTFTICNGDNLYSVNALSLLREPRKALHALISYSRSGLQFPDERISKFAVMALDESGYLENIIEKPAPEVVEKYRDANGEIGVSMNVFSFDGASIDHYIKACPIHPERLEKELPEAVRMFVKENPKQFLSFTVTEHLPDLTAADDIEDFAQLQ